MDLGKMEKYVFHKNGESHIILFNEDSFFISKQFYFSELITRELFIERLNQQTKIENLFISVDYYGILAFVGDRNDFIENYTIIFGDDFNLTKIKNGFILFNPSFEIIIGKDLSLEFSNLKKDTIHKEKFKEKDELIQYIEKNCEDSINSELLNRINKELNDSNDTNESNQCTFLKTSTLIPLLISNIKYAKRDGDSVQIFHSDISFKIKFKEEINGGGRKKIVWIIESEFDENNLFIQIAQIIYILNPIDPIIPKDCQIMNMNSFILPSKFLYDYECEDINPDDLSEKEKEDEEMNFTMYFHEIISKDYRFIVTIDPPQKLFNIIRIMKSGRKETKIFNNLNETLDYLKKYNITPKKF